MTTPYKKYEKAVKKPPRVRPLNRKQKRLEVVDVEGLIGKDHPARAIWELSQQLDLESLYEKIGSVEGKAGRSPHDPRVLLCVWAYAYSRGWSSAREVCRLSRYEPGLRWLTCLEVINYHTLSDFRVNNQRELNRWMTQLLGILHQAGLVKLQRVAQDGTRIRANASGKSFSGKEGLEKHLELAEEQIQELNRPDYEKGTKRQQKARRKARQEKKQRLERARQELEKLEQSQREKQRRVSRTDPEARIMKEANGGFGANYNVQMASDDQAGVVVAVEVSQSGADVHQLAPLLEQMEQRLGRKPTQWLTDGGYTSAENIEEMSRQQVEYFSPLAQEKKSGQLQSRGVSEEFWPDQFTYDERQDCYWCPAKERLSFVDRQQRVGKILYRYRALHSVCQKCPFKSQCCPQTRRHGRSLVRTEPTEAVVEFRQRMESERGREIYRKRGEIAEFPFAWIKDKMKFRSFRLRGLNKVRTEILWAVLAYNAQIWKRHCWQPVPS